MHVEEFNDHVVNYVHEVQLYMPDEVVENKIKWCLSHIKNIIKPDVSKELNLVNDADISGYILDFFKKLGLHSDQEAPVVVPVVAPEPQVVVPEVAIEVVPEIPVVVSPEPQVITPEVATEVVPEVQEAVLEVVSDVLPKVPQDEQEIPVVPEAPEVPETIEVTESQVLDVPEPEKQEVAEPEIKKKVIKRRTKNST